MLGSTSVDVLLDGVPVAEAMSTGVVTVAPDMLRQIVRADASCAPAGAEIIVSYP